MTQNKSIQLTALIPNELAGLRLDVALSKLFPDYSRARLQSWVQKNAITVNGKHLRSRDLVKPLDEVIINAVEEVVSCMQAEQIPLDIIYEDDALLVLNKPIGLVVHPGAGNREHTLVNALLHHCKSLELLPRAGIVHRLDKGTSGLLLVGKTLVSHTALVAQLAKHAVKRHYLAIVHGVLTAGGTVDQPIGRHPHHRTKMTVITSGKPSITHYRVVQRYRAHTLLRLQLETGRTHQIRVHMSHLHHPVVGDPIYGGRLHIPKGANENLIHTIRHYGHQALHAEQLEFKHPITREILSFKAEAPKDFKELAKLLEMDMK